MCYDDEDDEFHDADDDGKTNIKSCGTKSGCGTKSMDTLFMFIYTCILCLYIIYNKTTTVITMAANRSMPEGR